MTAAPGQGTAERRRGGGVRLAISPPPGPEDAREAWRGHWGRAWPPGSYEGMLRTLSRLPFPRARQLVVTLRREDELLSAAKVYLIPSRLDGSPVLGIGIGAVLTPRGLRGRGHASDLLRRVHRFGHERGGRVAMLHSDIAPAFYERLGYVSLPCRGYRAAVGLLPPARGGRRGHAGDMAPVLRAWSESARGRFLGMTPLRGWLHFKQQVAEWAHREGPGRREHPSFLVARDGSFLLSRCFGDEMQLVLWGGAPRAVLGLARAAAEAVSATCPRRVVWEGPGASALAAEIRGARSSRDTSFMARRLGPGAPLRPRGASDPFPLERY